MKLNPDDFVTADEHYFHGGIIEYTERPWPNVQAHNKGLVKNHNAVVGPDDSVWHVGDFTMATAEYAGKVEKQVLSRLNGRHHLVLGNHDEWKPFRYVRGGFWTVHTSVWLDYGDYLFVLAHDPSIYTILETQKNTFMLCGHIHKLFQHLLPDKRIINVGVDAWDYTPVRMSRILDLIRQHGWEI